MPLINQAKVLLGQEPIGHNEDLESLSNEIARLHRRHDEESTNLGLLPTSRLPHAESDVRLV